MKNLAHYLGMLTIFFSSAASHAELIYSPHTVLDTATGNTWKAYSTLEEGLLNGFKPATVAQTAALFLDYAPLNNGGNLPDYNPKVGGVTSMVTSENGMSFSVDWKSSVLYEYDGYSPPSLLDAFGYNVVFGGGHPGADRIKSLVSLVQDGDSWSLVALRSTFAAYRYGDVWGSELGAINPSEKYFQWNANLYYVCTESCSVDGNPYLDSTGAVKLGGYLMVSAVPELPPAISLFAGLLCLSLIAKIRRQKYATK